MFIVTSSLPDSPLGFVAAQVARGSDADADRSGRGLARADEWHWAQERLEALLREGLEGEETAFTPQDWQAIRQQALAQVRKPPINAV